MDLRGVAMTSISDSPIPMPRDLSSLIPHRGASNFDIKERMPTQKTPKQFWTEQEAVNPPLSPEEALASDAELGPAYDGNKRADNHVSKIHTEIQVNGKTIARVYNGGSIEIADEYRFLSNELRESFASDRDVGPDLAEQRATHVKAALERHGVLAKDELDPDAMIAATRAKTPVVELLRASTAQTQEEWLEMKATETPMPGAFLSMTA
jgi:hypothetical protein